MSLAVVKFKVVINASTAATVRVLVQLSSKLLLFSPMMLVGASWFRLLMCSLGVDSFVVLILGLVVFVAAIIVILMLLLLLLLLSFATIRLDDTTSAQQL